METTPLPYLDRRRCRWCGAPLSAGKVVFSLSIEQGDRAAVFEFGSADCLRAWLDEQTKPRPAPPRNPMVEPL